MPSGPGCLLLLLLLLRVHVGISPGWPRVPVVEMWPIELEAGNVGGDLEVTHTG